MKVFTIIVTYNGKQWYDRCFGSLRSSEIPLQTIVVDNASSDDTIQYIKENYPEIILIKSDKNLGFGQANNKGMKYALDNNADYIFLLNQDAWIEPDTIEKLVNIHQENKQFGILSPMHLNAEKNRIDFLLIKYISKAKHQTENILEDLYFNRLKQVYEMNYINAAAWLLPRKTLEIVGGFDPLFFLYGEDDNYMNRVLFNKMKIGICPHIHIVHDRENRRNKQKEDTLNFKRYLLIDASNINKAYSIKTVLLLYFRSLKSLLLLKVKRFSFYFRSAFYLTKMHQKIVRSRSCNVMQQGSWL